MSRFDEENTIAQDDENYDDSDYDYDWGEDDEEEYEANKWPDNTDDVEEA